MVMVCHWAEFVPAGGRFMGRGCHADGSGRAKVDWPLINNKATILIRPRQFFVPPVITACSEKKQFIGKLCEAECEVDANEFHANCLVETKNSASCFNKRWCRTEEISPMLPMTCCDV